MFETRLGLVNTTMRSEDIQRRYDEIMQRAREVGKTLGQDPEVQAALRDMEPAIAEVCGAFQEGLREGAPAAPLRKVIKITKVEE